MVIEDLIKWIINKEKRKLLYLFYTSTQCPKLLLLLFLFIQNEKDL